MVDPFFTTWNNQWSNNAETQDSINKLMSQQQQIQEKYKELKELLKDEDLTPNQQQEIKEQMQNLSDLYSQNKLALATLQTNIAGEKEIHVDKNINTEKSWSKSFSFKKFAIGCGILLLLFLGWLVVVFYSLINDPNRLNAFWVEWCTAVSLLQIFSIVFFWLLFFAWLTLFLINLNRLIVTKNKRKFPYALGSILSFIILVTVAFLLVMMLNRLSKEAENCIDPWKDQIVYSQVVVKDQKFNSVYLPESEYSKMIAPINVWFTLNRVKFNNETLTLGSVRNINVTLHCWNWQELQLSSDWLSFWWTCFYTQMWRYQPELIINYNDALWNQKSKVYDNPSNMPEIKIASELSVQSEQMTPQILNSSLLVWKNPVNMKFDASSVFKDFNLYNYDEIKWSTECNWIWDKNWRTQIDNEYKNEWVYNVCVSFPSLLSDYIYTFPIRVEQWDIPQAFSASYTVSTSESDKVYKDATSIQIHQLPTVVTVQVANVSPETPSTQKKMYKDGEQIASLFSDTNTFKITIDEDRPYLLTLEISDAEKEISSQYNINISVKRDVIAWSLSVSPGTVWTSPFTVQFDAFTTTLNDSDDEIVFFSRDFWDWKTNKDTSTSIISHTYEYDFVNENGVYYPSVVLRTKKWLTYIISWTIISVKKPETTIEIFLDEHPAQLASVWENIPISISLDGMPTKVYRNFWDWETQECDWRSCSETFHSYSQEWAYTISVKADFNDSPSLEWKINLLIQ